MRSTTNTVLTKLMSGIFALALVTLPSYSAYGREMTFEVRSTGGNCFGCEWIAAEGEITSNTPKRFSDFVKKNELENIALAVHLNSDGGDPFAGMALGELIRKEGLSTEVASSRENTDYPETYTSTPGKCISACAFAFFGGTTRSASAGEIGLHQLYDAVILKPTRGTADADIELAAQQVIPAALLEYTLRMGVAPQLLANTAAMRSTAMYFPTAAELEKFRISWNPDEFQAWATEPYRQGIIARSITQSGGEIVTAYCRRNGAFQVLLTGRDFSSYLKAGEPMPQPTVFGFDLDRKNARLRKVGGKDALEISMKAEILNELGLGTADTDGNLSISFDTPRYAYNLFHFNLPTRGAADSFRLVARNCIN